MHNCRAVAARLQRVTGERVVQQFQLHLVPQLRLQRKEGTLGPDKPSGLHRGSGGSNMRNNSPTSNMVAADLEGAGAQHRRVQQAVCCKLSRAGLHRLPLIHLQPGCRRLYQSRSFPLETSTGNNKLQQATVA